MKKKADIKPKPKPTAEAPKKAPTGRFSILEHGPGMAASLRETLARDEAAVMLAGDPNKKRLVVPVPSFGFQAMIKGRGIVAGTVVDVIGADGLGKSTLAYTMAGWAMAANGPVMYAESEGKPLLPERAKACLHPDKRIAGIFYDSIYHTPVRELREAANEIERWLITVRGPKSRYPHSATAFVFLDTFSKLMSPDEAAGFAVYDSKKDTESKKIEAKKQAIKDAKKGIEAKDKKQKESVDTTKELGSGSNFQHSKLSQEWSRRIAYFLGVYNAVLVLIRHQNDKIDMGGGGGMVLSADQRDMSNRTSIGGRAWLQSAAYQFVLSNKGQFKASIAGQQTAVGIKVGVKVTKNGYGPSLLQGEYLLSLHPRYETELRYEPALNFDFGLAEYLKVNKLMKVSVKNANTVVCSDFNAAGRAEEIDSFRFAEMFYQHGKAEALGRQLGFAHYDENAKVAQLIAAHVPELIVPDADAVDMEAPALTEEVPALTETEVSPPETEVSPPGETAPETETPSEPEGEPPNGP